MIFKNFILKNYDKNIYFKDFLFIFGLISFFFLWDIKINIYQNFTIPFREAFYLLFIYLLIDYKSNYNKVFFRIFAISSLIFVHIYLSNPFSLNLLDFRFNILPIFFLFFIILICHLYIKEIIKNLNLVFIIFIYLLIFSFFFGEVDNLSTDERERLCGIFSFRLVKQLIFLEPSHLGMVLVPFYYYIFQIDKITNFQKIILLLFFFFIFLFYYSVTLLFSIIICFVLMLVIDYRFFVRNKLFFLCQLLILLLPIFKSSCVYKVDVAMENLNFPEVPKVKNYDDFRNLMQISDNAVKNAEFSRDKVEKLEIMKLELFGIEDLPIDEYLNAILNVTKNFEEQLGSLTPTQIIKVNKISNLNIIKEKITNIKKLILKNIEFLDYAIDNINEKVRAITLLEIITLKDYIKLIEKVIYDDYIKSLKDDNLKVDTNINIDLLNIKLENVSQKKVEEILNNISNSIKDLTIKINKLEATKNIAMESYRGNKPDELDTLNKVLGSNYKKLKGIKEIQKFYIKKRVSFEIPNLTAKKMNYLIRQNVDLFPLKKNNLLNDHSSAVLVNAITVTYYSIKDKPFGWGINNYQFAFNKYMLENIIPTFPEIYYLNFNDASNNSLKLIVEFGVFSLLIFLNLLYFIFNKKISISQRALFAGIILTQMARAAGYFNGGFILCLVITFILNYRSLYKNEQ